MKGLPVFLLVCLCALPASAQEPTLALVLERAAAYVSEFHQKLSGIVAEERYVQDVRMPPLQGSRGVRGTTHRALTSDLLLVRPAGTDSYVEFRDVFAVDDHPVRDRSDRLMNLFVSPSAQTAEQAGRILAESARYNIGDIERNVNTPTFPLTILEAAIQPRFAFTRSRDRAPKTAASSDGAFRIGTEVWVIAFEEKQRETLIRTGRGLDLPASGRFWIEPATGRILMSELIVEDTRLRATIDVSYQSEPLVGLLVPIEMREQYENKVRDTRIDGRATYGRFRQFQVNVDEKLAPIVK